MVKQSGKPGAKKILIVEDDQFLLDLCVKRFNQSGYKVDFAVDGEKGLEKIIENKPDLILLDLIIPGIDGFDVLKKVRVNKSKSIAKIPIIVLSNLGQKSDVQKALKLGASDYLIKAHFTTDDIISKVKKHLKE
ncbi:response regulator [Candidatus Parcubacteria bacterium]|nr:response regulator [Candidatus Parcubacteria bacterium]